LQAEQAEENKFLSLRAVRSTEPDADEPYNLRFLSFLLVRQHRQLN